MLHESVKCYRFLVHIFSMLSVCFEPAFMVFIQRSLDTVQSVPTASQTEPCVFTANGARAYPLLRCKTPTLVLYSNNWDHLKKLWIHRNGCQFLCLWATRIWEVEGQRSITSDFDTSIKGFMVFLLMACSISMTASSLAVSGSERSS